MGGLENVLPLRPSDGREALRDYGAPLPEKYRRAATALAELDRIDECKDWADRAEALRSYARQSKDRQLEIMAKRIRARAIRRAGELLKQIEPNPGGRPEKTPAGDHQGFYRADAARNAGMSEHQAKQSTRIANIPAQDFDDQVEADNPPSLSALADQGRAARSPRPPVPQADEESEDLTVHETDEYFRKVLSWCDFGLLDPDLLTGQPLEALRAGFGRLPARSKHKFRAIGRAVAMITGENQ